VLPQFKRLPNPPAHQFTVFSVINDDDTVKPKFAQCTNCGVIHRVTEISRSEIVQGREAMSSILSISDIRASLPEGLAALLENSQADLPTWEAVQFIYENKQWGNFVVLTSDTEGDTKQGKYVRLLGEKMFKVEIYERTEVIK
jgi:hypothetical protein